MCSILPAPVIDDMGTYKKTRGSPKHIGVGLLSKWPGQAYVIVGISGPGMVLTIHQLKWGYANSGGTIMKGKSLTLSLLTHDKSLEGVRVGVPRGTKTTNSFNHV